MTERRAFTLAELMVVVCIIALLMAIVVPNLVGTQTQARSLLCRNNLKEIGKSVAIWASRNNAWGLEPLASGGWPGVVANLTGSKECLKCPEGDELKEGCPVENQLVIRTGPTSNTAVPLVGLMDGGGFKVLKLSGSQWGSGIGECARYEPVPYVPDSKPNVYWWGYDDGAIGSGDYDFQDLAIRVTKHGDGTASIYVQANTAGKPEVWSPDLTQCYAHWDEINVWQKNHGHGHGTSVEFKLNVGGASHYAMNVSGLDIRMPRKLQALDYLSATAYSTDNWNNPEWDKDEDDRPDFLRHRGRVNVLFTGGGVEPRSRDQVDPVDVQVERELWQPGSGLGQR
jgi:prepilin-type N-terminal cleavage/methylation domain-containing protein/prepilin-type processing-associated H-X9-DG protein